MRESGYYWIRREDAYAVACWDEQKSVWWIPGYEEGFKDEQLEVVGDKRLRPTGIKPKTTELAMQRVDGIPRRSRLDLMTPAELAIHQAIGAVEEIGAHPFLTNAIVLLDRAKDSVANYVELPQQG